MGRLTFVRLAWFTLAFVTLVTWLAVLPGCSVDRAGLDNALVRRGETDVSDSIPATADGGSTVTTVDGDTRDAGLVGPDVQSAHPEVDAGFSPDVNGAVSTDGGASEGNPSMGDASIADTGVEAPPSECPLEPTRSLSSCSGAATLAMCRYTLDGHPALQVGCTAEGYLCVKVCP